MSNLKDGEERGGYIVQGERISRGAMAMGYKATEGPGGRLVFLKQYTSPKPSVDWYRGYVDYQRELKRRIESSNVKAFTYEFVGFFEATRPPAHRPASKQYYQAFEWVTGGKDLQVMLDELRAGRERYSWDQRVTWAKVIAGSVAQLHVQNIAHIDLKPENLILIPDSRIAVGYRLKLIDMDFSLLTDKLAPWHGVQGYVGTPGWMSPEHFKANAVPGAGSDVFTCGLILYELLAGGNPYKGLSQEDYATQVNAHAASRPRLEGEMPGGNTDEVGDLLHRCLSPDVALRPSALEVNRVLIGPAHGRRPAGAGTRTGASTDAGTRAGTGAPAAGTGAAAGTGGTTRTGPRAGPSAGAGPGVGEGAGPTPAGTSDVAGRLTLGIAGGEGLTMRITTRLNQHILRRFGEEARFWDNDWQATLQKRDDGWYVIPNPGAPNDTLLNGKKIVAATKVRTGDELAVGRESKGIAKLPLRLDLEGEV